MTPIDGLLKISDQIYVSEYFPYLEPYTERHYDAFKTSGLLGAMNNGYVTGVRPDKPTDSLYILLRDYTLVWKTDDGTWFKILVPAGFTTDIASIPTIVQLLFKMRPDGPIRTAALVHDLLYQLKRYVLNGVIKAYSTKYDEWYVPEQINVPLEWGKAQSDKLFAKIMKAYDTRLSTLTYLGVRYGGFFAYKRNDPMAEFTVRLLEVPSNAREFWQHVKPIEQI